ncbi:MAG: ribokinase [Chloroflexi bacterium]|nr:ribokinase [Chloroflexota bacterium]
MDAYVVVLGGLNFDLVIRGSRMPNKGESVFGKSFHTFPGGKGANQAVQLARLGVQTCLLGRVGNDIYGDHLIASLEGEGLRTDALIRDSELGTGKGWVFVDDEGDNYIIILPEANMNWAKGDLEALADLLSGAACLLCQLETPVPIVKACLRQAKDAGLMTVLNTAPATTLPADLFTHVDLLILNQTEAAFYLGHAVAGADQARAAAADLLAKGCGAVVITLGDQGAVAADGSGICHCGAFSVRAVDVTAAGDSFCAALAYALLQGDDLYSGLKFACASGALTVTRAGAQPSLPKLAEIRAFMESESARHVN